MKDGVTTFYITSIANSGTAPGDTAPAATMSYTAINGTVGTAITTVTPTLTGLLGASNITYTHVGNLPAGLSLDTASGAISGTPTAVGATTVTITGAYTNALGLSKTLSTTVAINVVATSTAKPALVGSVGKATGAVPNTVYQVSTDGNTWTDVTANSSGELILAAGTYSVKVKATATVQTNVVVSAVTVTGVAVTTQPTKTTYNVGDALDLSNLVVTLTKSNGTTEAVALADFAANGITLSIQNGATLTAADTTLTITVNGKTAKRNITL